MDRGPLISSLLQRCNVTTRWYNPYASHRHIPTYSDTSDVFLTHHSNDNQVFLTLSDIYAQMSMTSMTSKMHTYASQAIVMSPSTYTLKSQWFPLICDDPTCVMWATDFVHVTDFPLHSDASKPGDLGLSPMQLSVLCPVLFDIPYSYPRSLFEIIPFPLPCSLPFHCKV
jgi:hypothetical protein